MIQLSVHGIVPLLFAIGNLFVDLGTDLRGEYLRGEYLRGVKDLRRRTGYSSSHFWVVNSLWLQNCVSGCMQVGFLTK
jgi:hypothetical protein